MFYVLCFIYVDIHPVHFVILRLSEPSFSSYLLKNVSVTQNAVSFSQNMLNFGISNTKILNTIYVSK